MSLLIDAIERRRWNEVPNYLHEAKRKSPYNRTALHHACEERAPFEIIKLIFQAFPEATCERTRHGYTPISYCLEYNNKDSDSYEQVMFYFLEKSPESFLVQDNFNEYPLHLAIQNYKSAHLIQKILETQPSVIHKKNRYNENPLHMFLRIWCFKLNIVLRNLKVSSMSPDEFLLTVVQYLSVKYTIRELYDTFICLFSALISDDLETNQNERYSLLQSCITHPYCPWLWCELVLRLHPDQIFVGSDSQIPLIALVDPYSKMDLYENLLRCEMCGAREDSYWFDVDGSVCIGCFQHIKQSNKKFEKVTLKEFVSRDAVEFIYKLLLENPSYQVNGVI